MYMIFRFNHIGMDVTNVVRIYVAIISVAPNEFLPGDNKDLQN